MKVGQLMTIDVRCCHPGDTLQTAAAKMWEFDCGSIPVTGENGHVVGMLTDRDVCMATMLNNARPADITVEQAMSREVHTCRTNDTIEAAEKLMEVYQIRRLPVLDDRGVLVGILSLNDLAREAAREIPEAGSHEVSAEGLAGAMAGICAPRFRRGNGAAEAR
jgi:CBS domain-containing protein